MKLRVAGLQMAVQDDIEANTGRILEAIKGAAAEGADILLTPEGGLSGYTHVFDHATVAGALTAVTDAAKGAGVGLALGTCFVEADGKCYNQLRFYRPDGHYLGFHAKLLRCGTLASQPEGEINDYADSDLQVFQWTDDLVIGGLICNDLWANPQCTPMPDTHLSQVLGDMGARVIFHAVNGGRDGGDWSRLVWHYHDANLRMRAKAGNCWMVTVDNCSPPHLPCSSPSGVIDPDGDWVCDTAPCGEQFFVHTIDI